MSHLPNASPSPNTLPPQPRATVPPWQFVEPGRIPNANVNSAPPIPPRGSSYNHSSLFSPFASYGSVGSPFSPFSPYGAPFYGGAGVGRSLMNDGAFAFFANENARPAFEKAEAVVMAVRSVSLMVESTYQAVRSTFLAVVGVADHFSNLKNHLGSILSSLTLLRFFKWILDRVLTFLGIEPTGSRSAIDWSEAFKRETIETVSSKHVAVWPLLAFFGVALGAPWILRHLLQSTPASTDDGSWSKGAGERYIARAEHGFRAGAADELSFDQGDILMVAPKHLQPSNSKGWLLASKEGVGKGLVPVNHIQILMKRESECR